MTTLIDFERDKKEIKTMVDSLNKICNLDTDENLESDIKYKLFELHKKVKQTSGTLDNILNDLSNIQKDPLSKLQKSLQELIVHLETSVCVPEFCINSDIHNSCEYLTKKLIDHLQEVTFCFDLTDVPRASNRGAKRLGVDKSQSMYKSIAPNSNLIRDSMIKKSSIKCKRRQMRKERSKLPIKTGRFTVTSHSEAPSVTIGKKKRKLKSKRKHKKRSHRSIKKIKRKQTVSKKKKKLTK